LKYLLDFLESHSLTNEKEPSKNISPATLGLIFEKINNYKDGSFYTPSVITDYMTQQAIEKAIIDKINAELDTHGTPFETYNDVAGYISGESVKNKVNQIVNSVKICDPAVGSGHFLVSALNAFVLAKYKMGILVTDKGESIRQYCNIDIKNSNLYILYKGKEIQEFQYTETKNPQDESYIIQKTLFKTKKEIIENNLFGVDINPKSVEIARLRLWIELLENAYYTEESGFNKMETLPNIDINIKQGDSLISIIPNFQMESPTLPFHNEIKDAINEYRTKVQDYKNNLNNVTKKDIEFIHNKIKDNVKERVLELLLKEKENKIKEFKDKLKRFTTGVDISTIDIPDELTDNRQEELSGFSNKKTLSNTFEKEITKIIKNYKAYIEDFERKQKEIENSFEKTFFEWQYEFPEVIDEEGKFIGFDVVIGNPPYIQLQSKYSDDLEYADLFENQKYKVFDRMSDIYCLFYEKGMQILKDNGYLCYITSNKWMRAGYGEKLRKFFLEYNPKILIDLGPGVFESATVDTNILLIQKSANKNELKALNLQKEDKQNIDKAFKAKSVNLTNLGSDAWFIGSDAEQRLKKKIESIGKPLKDWDVKIYYGIKTGLNEAFIITTEKRNEILANCKDEEERERTEVIIKPILRGRDIKRYYYEWADLWVIVIPAGWTNQNKEKEDDNPETFIEKTFPALMEYLKTFETKAKKREDKGDYWWELRHCAYYPEFEKEKVVYSEIVQHPQFYFDKNGFYVEATSFLMTGENIKYICGLLNSKPVAFFFKKYYAGGGLGEKGYRYKKAFLENLPIPSTNDDNEPIVTQIETLVAEILTAKKQYPQTDTKQLERQIDQLVYQLYDLTEDEIAIIENQL
jgi:type II restriction/modification system DNA methylase subunit YeeA